MKSVNEAIRIVLVSPSHAGNIGAAARAMKTMGLSRLYLVAPRCFPSAEANVRASGATDVLEHAQIVENLDDALSDCVLVMGSTARFRNMSQPGLNAREAAKKIVQEASLKREVALVFGRERTGLENKELMRCHYHVSIPAVSHFSSLNLSSAVQVLAYELRMAQEEGGQSNESKDVELANMEELEGLYRHIEDTMIAVGFLNPEVPRHMMRRIRELINRARVDRDELDLLRGMMKAVQKTTNHNT